MSRTRISTVLLALALGGPARADGVTAPGRVETGVWRFTVREVTEDSCGDGAVDVGDGWEADVDAARDGTLEIGLGDGGRLRGAWRGSRFAAAARIVIVDPACEDCDAGAGREVIEGYVHRAREGTFTLTRRTRRPGEEDCRVTATGGLTWLGLRL